MINKLLTLLRSPYPSLVKRWKSVIIPSLIVFLILFVLQPFGISMMGGYKFWVVLGYGVVSSLALSISTYLFPALFPRYHSEKNWTLGRELLGTLGACLLIAIGNCFGLGIWFIHTELERISDKFGLGGGSCSFPHNLLFDVES